MQQVRARAHLGLLDQLIVIVHTAPDAVVRMLNLKCAVHDLRSTKLPLSTARSKAPGTEYLPRTTLPTASGLLALILVEGVVRAGDDIVLHKQRMPGEVAAADDPAIEYRVRLPLAVNQHLWSACATPACRYDASL